MPPYSEARADLIAALDPSTGYYSHTLPFAYNSGFIDGQAWTSIAWGACLLVGDLELAALFETFNLRLLGVGPDARNYAPAQLSQDWIHSTDLPDYWYLVKPQAFAGPAGIHFAIKCGAKIPDHLMKRVPDPIGNAKLMVMAGFAFGLLAKYDFVQQYCNSMWTAHLLLGKKPSSTMMWMCEENPFFSYIAGKKCNVPYPLSTRYTEGTETKEKKIQKLSDCTPSAWVFRRDPFKRYSKLGQPQAQSYTRIWQLVGDYLQSTL